MRPRTIALLLTAFALLADGAAASQLRIAHAAIARGLHEGLMTTDGRWFLQGASAEDCAHAFVQNPRVDAVGERLRITLLFSGRAAVPVGAKCVGPGDTFDVSVSGVPLYQNGEIVLSDPRLTAPDRKYFSAVSGLLEQSFRSALRYPLRNAVEWAVHDLRERTGRHVVLDGLALPGIHVEPDGVRVEVDMSLEVN